MPMVFPTSPTVGQVFSSGGRSWVWTGSTWDSPSSATAALSGLTLIRKINIGTAVSSIVAPNVFSSTYRNYVVVLAGSSMPNGSSILITFNNSVGLYDVGGAWWIFNGTRTDYGQNSQSTVNVGLGGTEGTTNTTMEIYNPFLTQRTSFFSRSISAAYSAIFGGGDRQAVSNTGFTLATSPGVTFTGGALYVYGMRDE